MGLLGDDEFKEFMKSELIPKMLKAKDRAAKAVTRAYVEKKLLEEKMWDALDSSEE